MATDHEIVSRGIRSVQDVVLQENSATHTAGFIIAPGNWEDTDPFLIMAEDHFQRGTFGMHPHRGIETVTYVISGQLEHADNKGGQGVLRPGDVQWMTAGKGLLHTEDPAAGDTVHSLQLWVNLPSAVKMTEPRYQNMSSNDMPVRHENGATIRVFSGSSQGVTAKTLNYTPVTMVEIIVEPGFTIKQDIPGAYNGFLYIVSGKGTFGSDETLGQKGQVLWMERINSDQRSELIIRADEKLHLMFYAGQPIEEPVVARGPFVMNTEEEIAQAYADFRAGKFN